MPRLIFPRRTTKSNGMGFGSVVDLARAKRPSNLMTLLLIVATSVLVAQSVPGRRSYGPVSAISNAGAAVPIKTATPCTGDKDATILTLALRVWDGHIRIDKTQSTLKPSDLFMCRGSLAENTGKKQRFERHLLDGLDKVLLSRPRFYLTTLTVKDREALVTYLPDVDREELIPFLTKSEKVKFFLYMPDEVRLEVINDLSLDQKKDYFAYLPAEAQAKVLDGLSESDKAALQAKKKVDPPPTGAPDHDADRVAVARHPGGEKETKTSGSWGEFLKAYQAWQATKAAPQPILSVLDSFFTHNLTDGILGDTAIIGFDDASDTVDWSAGRVTLRVTDPIGDLTVPDDYRVAVPPAIAGLTDAKYITPSVTKILSVLQPLKGELWERNRIKSYINDYFIRDRTGYERTARADQLSVSAAAAEPKCITVQPVPELTRIVFFGELKEADVLTALRELLTDRDLDTYRHHPGLLTKCKDQQPSASPTPDQSGGGAGSEIAVQCQQINFQDFVGTGNRLPYLNLQNWQSQQAGMAQAGFLSALKPLPFDDSGDDCPQVVRLVAEIWIEKASTSDESILTTPSASPAPANPAPTPAATPVLSIQSSADSPRTFGPAADLLPAFQAVPSPSPSPSPSASPEKPAIEKPKRNALGFELVYRPGQLIRIFEQYTYTRPGKDDFSVRFGTDADLLVSGNYESVDLFRHKFAHTFPFAVSSYSDSLSNRVLDHVKLDERRSGAAFRISTDLKRNPTLLNFYFEARHETVALEDHTRTINKQNISSFTVGAIYSSSSKGARFRRQWQMEPTVKFGLGIGDQPRFTVWQVNGLLHQFLPHQFDLIFDGRLDLASKNTPLFEQPSFGSPETVRGFRTDDAIGRRQWALKNEFLMPVPGTTPDSTGLLRMLREKLKLAAFVDVGGIFQTTGSNPGVRFGPGAGLRFNYQGVDLGVDWAYGLGDANNGRGRGRFYFTVSREISRRIRQ